MLREETGPEIRSVAADRILEKLRIDIVTRKFMQGDKIVEQDLALQYGTSRGAVRGALSDLEREGLIRVLPNGRKEVIGFSKKQAQDMYELRWMIENRAVQIILEKRTTFFAPLLSAVKRIESALTQKDPQTDWYALDIGFHRAILQTAENSPLLKAWEINIPVMYALMQLNTTRGYRENYIAEFYQKHRTLFELIVTDNVQCYEYLRTHIMDAQEISAGVLSEPD